MFIGTRITYSSRWNKGISSTSSDDYTDQQAPDEGRRVERPKHCNSNNKGVMTIVRMLIEITLLQKGMSREFPLSNDFVIVISE